PLTYFEIATALAFLAMAEAGVEIAVLETGLGGRLDAVTTCVPCATAITSIGLDHTEYLGDTLAGIAREKAGILKPAVTCFVGGAGVLAATLPALAPGRRLVLLVSIVGDKDADAMLAALAPVAAAVVTTRSDNPRALPPEELGDVARRHAADVVACDDAGAA